MYSSSGSSKSSLPHVPSFLLLPWLSWHVMLHMKKQVKSNQELKKKSVFVLVFLSVSMLVKLNHLHDPQNWYP